MVTEQSIQKQLKHLGFKTYGWGRSEVRELPHIILPDEKIFECVNGIYEGGFALLVATDVRLILVDKKPLNYLTVEDLRFDMINQIDYNHRLLGAHIHISSGEKRMKFRSYNQPRLRKLISHVQHCMAEGKKKVTDHQEGQNQRLEQINQQLQAYLMAQHQHQETLHSHLQQLQQGAAVPLSGPPQPVRPSPELSDYLFAQSLLDQYQRQNATTNDQSPTPAAQLPLPAQQASAQDPAAAALQGKAPVDFPQPPTASRAGPPVDLYAEGMKEVFGKHQAPAVRSDPAAQASTGQGSDSTTAQNSSGAVQQAMDNLYRPHDQADRNLLLRIAYSKLPMALRNRKFNRRPKLRTPDEVEV